MQGWERWRRTGVWILIGCLVIGGQAVAEATESELDRSRHARQSRPEPVSENELIEAAKAGRIEEVKRLIAVGANVNAATEGGKTPLHGAAAFGHEAVVQALLKVGANVNAADQDGRTPLHEAAAKGPGAVVEMLLKAGANVNAVTKDGSTNLR
jgi:ankyrin repeat protein